MIAMKIWLILCLILAGHEATASSILDAFRTSRQNAVGPIEDSCVEHAHAGNCFFYLCFEDRHPCPTRNYATEYGWRFCSRFDREKDRMTVDGRRWLNDTRQCSMEHLLVHYRAASVVCSDIAATMKDQHGACEVESGLCSHRILFNNREIFTDVYALNRQSVTQCMHSMKHCAVSTARQVASWFRDQISHIPVMPVVREVRSQLRELGVDILHEIGRLRNYWNDSEDAQNIIEALLDDDDDDPE